MEAESRRKSKPIHKYRTVLTCRCLVHGAADCFQIDGSKLKRLCSVQTGDTHNSDGETS